MDQLTERYKIARLIARKVSGTLTGEEVAALEEWIEASEEHREEMIRIEKRLKEDVRRGRELDAEAEWKVFQQRLPRKSSIRWWWYSAAAVVVGACVVVGALQLRDTKVPMQLVQSVENNIKEYKARLILDDGRAVNITDTTSQIIAVSEGASVTTSGSGLKYEMKKDSLASPARVKYNTLIVPRGGEYELLLSDGTRVWMNSESKLVYPVHFSGDFREVQMEGEVCFKVAKNERQPFIVKTQGISVEVLGTFFNVEAYPTDEVITTTLVEGRVNVSNGKQEYVMSPNQQVIADGGQLVVREVDAAEVVRWIEGVCYFSETSLEDIMDKLARWYDVEIFFANASAKEAHFSLEIERYDNIAAVLSKIEKTGRVKFKINGQTVIVEE